MGHDNLSLTVLPLAGRNPAADTSTGANNEALDGHPGWQRLSYLEWQDLAARGCSRRHPRRAERRHGVRASAVPGPLDADAACSKPSATSVPTSRSC
jgi:hypothetical protein